MLEGKELERLLHPCACQEWDKIYKEIILSGSIIDVDFKQYLKKKIFAYVANVAHLQGLVRHITEHHTHLNNLIAELRHEIRHGA